MSRTVKRMAWWARNRYHGAVPRWLRRIWHHRDRAKWGEERATTRDWESYAPRYPQPKRAGNWWEWY